MSRTTTVAFELRPGEVLEVSPGVTLTLEDKSGRVARIRVNAPEEVKVRRVDSSATNLAVMRARGVLGTKGGGA